jgi:23S rRNA pseudouridine955/2504/2580 synthase
VNKGRAKAGYRIQAGDRVRIPPIRLPAVREPGKPSQPLLNHLEARILYEDNRLIVVNKPSGMAVHGGSGISFGVIEALRALRPLESGLELVHRLDRDTSGCLLVAKRRSMLRWLHQLIRDKALDKRYQVLMVGRFERKTVRVDAPLRKNTLKSGERIVRVHPEGKPSTTVFRRIRQFTATTLTEAQLHTGRTHQIRVHAAYLGAPVIGDEKYGDRRANAAFREKGLKRLFLHATALTFPLPDGQGRFRIRAPLDPDLEAVLTKLR